MAAQAELTHTAPQGPSFKAKSLSVVHHIASGVGGFDNITGTVAVGSAVVFGSAGFIAAAGSPFPVVAGTFVACASALPAVMGASKVEKATQHHADAVSASVVPALRRTGAILLTAFSIASGVYVGNKVHHLGDAQNVSPVLKADIK